MIIRIDNWFWYRLKRYVFKGWRPDPTDFTMAVYESELYKVADKIKFALIVR
jgi:hypothetical protein